MEDVSARYGVPMVLVLVHIVTKHRRIRAPALGTAVRRRLSVLIVVHRPIRLEQNGFRTMPVAHESAWPARRLRVEGPGYSTSLPHRSAAPVSCTSAPGLGAAATDNALGDDRKTTHPHRRRSQWRTGRAAHAAPAGR